MCSFYEGDEEYRYFDAPDELSSPHSSLSDRLELSTDCVEFDDRASNSFEFKVWAGTPRSVRERRGKFLDLMGLEDEINGTRRKRMTDRIMQNSGAVLRNSSFEDPFSSSKSSLSSLSSFSNDLRDVSKENGSVIFRAEKENNQNQLYQVLGLESLEQLGVAGELESSLSSTSAARKAIQREAEGVSDSIRKYDKVKSKWLSRLRLMTCTDKPAVANNLRRRNPCSKQETRVQTVKVRHCKKQWKELSALFIGQDFQAHKGAISTMKFSLDGQYLATAGKDSVVRVWQVLEDMRSAADIPEIDPSCMYFTLDHFSDPSPYIREKERMNKLRNLEKTPDSTCVIFPPRVFRILEEPLHQFHGHSGEILDLSWSKHNYLLSSSVDKSVRIWRVGFQQCLRVFPHSNYVTCIEFNPVDDNYFISGSIDGKVRIWEITGGQVVDWADVRDIISAVCYRPGGKGAVVGCLTGVCRFYDISDDHFQLESQLSLHSKKKTPCKRITGFQFLPQDPSKLMVTCADAKVRIISGTNVVRKFKGNRCSGNQLFASFTSDGKHIVSTSEDSNVYVWDYSDHGDLPASQPKVIKSWEKFSTDVSVAIPWSGLKSRKSRNSFQFRFLDRNSLTALPAYFSLSQHFILESYPRVSATWPEEKLFDSSPWALTMSAQKAQFEFLKSACQSRSSFHAWDLVIVTAGLDGRIRAFHNYGLPVAL